MNEKTDDIEHRLATLEAKLQTHLIASQVPDLTLHHRIERIECALGKHGIELYPQPVMQSNDDGATAMLALCSITLIELSWLVVRQADTITALRRELREFGKAA